MTSIGNHSSQRWNTKWSKSGTDPPLKSIVKTIWYWIQRLQKYITDILPGISLVDIRLG